MNESPPSSDSPTSPTVLSDRPRTIEILSPNSSNDEPSSYGTAPEHEPGTAENPIIIEEHQEDQNEVTLLPGLGTPPTLQSPPLNIVGKVWKRWTWD